MYFEHFGLNKNPFTLSTAPGSLYYAQSHQEALAHLLYGVRQPNGITLLLGAPGTGKTTLIRSLIELLRPTQVLPSVVFAPMMESARDVLFHALAGFNVKNGATSVAELFLFFQGFVEEMANNGKQALLIVDEAQRLSVEVLDCLRLISSMEEHGRQSVRLLLVAQPELAKTVSTEALTALRQRVSMRCHLGRLQPDEVWKYVALRIAAADGDGRMLFCPEALDALAVYSGGIPRLINVLADHSLIAAFGHGDEQVGADLVSVVARQLDLAADDSMQQRVLQREGTARLTAADWRAAIIEYRSRQLPDFLKRFASSIATEQRSHSSNRIPAGHDRAASELASWTTSTEH